MLICRSLSSRGTSSTNGRSVAFAISALWLRRRTETLTSLDKDVALFYADQNGQRPALSPKHVTPGVEPSAAELLELDVDVRLVDVWLEVWKNWAWEAGEMSGLLRLAYGRGYCDALAEPERGKLCRDNGLAVPERRRA